MSAVPESRGASSPVGATVNLAPAPLAGVFYGLPMSTGAHVLEILEPSGALSPQALERIYSEQRQQNMRAIRLHAIECPSHVTVSLALARTISFWDGDDAAIKRGMAALERLAILIDDAALSEVARERAENWLNEARTALQRFQTPWGPA